jgi:hypothetical protein
VAISEIKPTFTVKLVPHASVINYEMLVNLVLRITQPETPKVTINDALKSRVKLHKDTIRNDGSGV